MIRETPFTLEHYNSEIREGVKSGNYKTIALIGGIKLARRPPAHSSHSYPTQRDSEQARSSGLVTLAHSGRVATIKRGSSCDSTTYLEEPQEKSDRAIAQIE